MLIYTSITKNYLPKARILAKSVKNFHPEWTFVLVCSDRLPTHFDLSLEPFDEVLTIEQLGLPNWKAWAFGHELVELCTAVKGPAAELLSQRAGVDKIMYIDPDIKVFNSLTSLELLLDQYDILLTPHLLAPEQTLSAIEDNEICALKHGIYNLGFFAAKTSGQGLQFISWWAERLRHFCRDDIPSGLFTDQRWCDLAPAFFSNLYIVRDKGCNVATWNLTQRPLSKNKTGDYLVGGTPLRFYHFTSYDKGYGPKIMKRNTKDTEVFRELWDDYGKDLKAEGHGAKNCQDWFYGYFENGEPVPASARRFYQQSLKLQQKFPDPYSTLEPSYLSLWKQQATMDKSHDSINNKRSLIKRLLSGIYSPHIREKIIKSVLIIYKHDGLFGLIKQIRNYK
jgi:hypothetical protein